MQIDRKVDRQVTWQLGRQMDRYVGWVRKVGNQVSGG